MKNIFLQGRTGHDLYFLFAQNLENFIRKNYEIRKLDLLEWQRDCIKKILFSFGELFSQYALAPPLISENKIFRIDNLPQYGVGGIDSIKKNMLIFSQASMQKNRFAYAFCHRYAHYAIKIFFNDSAFEKGKESFNIFYDTELINKPAHMLLDEGVTDLLAALIAADIGHEAHEDLMSFLYKPYREIIFQMARMIGENDFKKGFKHFLKAYLTGSGEVLRDKMDFFYKRQGGFSDFISILNNIMSYPIDLNGFDKVYQSKICMYASFYGCDLSSIKQDRFLKKLSRFAQGAQI